MAGGKEWEQSSVPAEASSQQAEAYDQGARERDAAKAAALRRAHQLAALREHAAHSRARSLLHEEHTTWFSQAGEGEMRLDSLRKSRSSELKKACREQSGCLQATCLVL